MTPKELLGLDADALEKMTQDELTAVFAPIFCVTRPELVSESKGPIKKVLTKSNKDHMLLAKAMRIAKEHGIELNI